MPGECVSHCKGRTLLARISAIIFGIALLGAPFGALAVDVPDGLSVEWQGKKPCEKVYEDAQIRVARCTFPPGAVHVRHSHPGYLTCSLSEGKGQVEDAKDKRLVDFHADKCTNSVPIPWHELTNVGDTTLNFLVIERKYEPVEGVTQTMSK